MTAIKKLLIPLLMALGVIAGVTGVVPGTPAPVASAQGIAVDGLKEYWMGGPYHDYLVRFTHYNNGKTYAEAFRYSRPDGFYLGREMGTWTDDFLCFIPWNGDASTPVRIWMKSNTAYGGETGTCDWPNQYIWTGCYPDIVAANISQHGYIGYTPNCYGARNGLTPFDFYVGDMAYGYWAPLREGWDHSNFELW